MPQNTHQKNVSSAHTAGCIEGVRDFVLAVGGMGSSFHVKILLAGVWARGTVDPSAKDREADAWTAPSFFILCGATHASAGVLDSPQGRHFRRHSLGRGPDLRAHHPAALPKRCRPGAAALPVRTYERSTGPFISPAANQSFNPGPDRGSREGDGGRIREVWEAGIKRG